MKKFDAADSFFTNTTKQAEKKGKAEPKTETKSKRVNLLVRPADYEAARKIAYMQRTSFNNLMTDLIKAYIKKHSDLVREYDNRFESEDR